MNLNKFSDQELVSLYIKGNEACLEILVNKYRSKIFSYILFLIKDRELSKDFFQDTMIKVIKTLRSGKYHHDGRFLPWVIRIAHNLVIDHFRKSKNLNTVSNGTFADEDGHVDLFNNARFSDETIESVLSKKQLKSDMRILVRLLPQDQKEVLILRHYEKMSFKEIANLTGVSINTALGRMRYALINLRKIVEEKSLDIMPG